MSVPKTDALPLGDAPTLLKLGKKICLYAVTLYGKLFIIKSYEKKKSCFSEFIQNNMRVLKIKVHCRKAIFTTINLFQKVGF